MLTFSWYRTIHLFRAVVLLLLCAVAPTTAQSASAQPPVPPAKASTGADSTSSPADVLFSKKLLTAVLDFRQLGLTDPNQALSRFGSPQAMRQFDRFNKSVFPISDQTNSWSYFFNTSVFVFGSPHPPRQVVAFYHPWSDVFLMMDWEEENGRFLITDAEIVVGDWIRNAGSVSIDPTPSWLQNKGFGPLALGISAGQTIAAFEKQFVSKSGQAFRNVLPTLKNHEQPDEPNYSSAASRLLYIMMKIDLLGERQDEDYELYSLWSETYRVAEQAAGGDLEGLFQTADKTLPTTKYFLKKLAPETFRDVVIADYYIKSEGWLVFLVPVFDAGYCFSLSFEPDGKNQMRIKRIDFISFSTFYDNYKKRAESL